MKATRIFADHHGVTHFETLEIEVLPAGPIGALSAPFPVHSLVFRETADTYDFDWHPAPRKQWIILLDGLIEIQVGDGARRQFGGGEILLVEDTTGPGHRTRQLSAGTRHSLFLPVA